MGLLCSRGKVHLDGHKDLTLHLPVTKISDAAVIGKLYIPKLMANGREIAFTVAIGDSVKKGQRIGLAPGFYMPVFAPVSGKITGIENLYNSLVGRPIPHFVLENDFKEEWGEPLTLIDLNKASRVEIVSAIKEAGICGLGGAGFPTYVKYEKEQPIECLIINSIECEPFLTSDYHAMQEHLTLFIQGVSILLKVSGAKEAVIAIKVGKPELVAKIRQEIGDRKDIRVQEMKDLYPMGWEKVLVQEILHKDYEGLPSEAGAIINNASTAIAVADALLNGHPITERLITISGDAIKPTMAIVPIYTKVQSLMTFLGGYQADEINLLAGGPMTSKAMMNDNFVIEKTTGGLLVLKCVEYVSEPCLRCGRCILACPSSLYPCEIKDAIDKKDFKRLRDLEVNKCVECGTCSYVCPSKIDIVGSIRKAKLLLKLEDAKAAPKK